MCAAAAASFADEPRPDVPPDEEKTPLLAAYMASWNHVMGPMLMFSWRIECPFTDHSKESQAHQQESDPNQNGDCSASHFLKCHYYLDNPESYIVENDIPHLTGDNVQGDSYAQCILQIIHGYLEHCRTRVCNRTSLVMLPERGVVIHAVTFTMDNSKVVEKPLCIAVVYDIRVLDDLWSLLPLADLTLGRIALTCTTSGKEFMKGISSVTTLLIRYFSLARFLLKTRTLDKSIAVKALARQSHPAGNEFLRKAIQSYFQTNNCAVVIGDNSSKIREFLHLLTMFMDPTDLIISHWELDESQLTYYPGLKIQGLLRDPQGATHLSARELMFSPHPTTIIDISQNKVWQCPLHVNYLNNTSSSSSEGFASMPPLEGKKLKSVKTPPADSEVSMFLLQIARVSDNDKAVEELVNSFRIFLKRKAQCLIKCSGRSRRALSATYLQTVLGIPHMSDFEIILAQADKINPGISSFIQT